MLKRLNLMSLFLFFALISNLPAAHGSLRLMTGNLPLSRALTDTISDREQDGLLGPVRRVRTETAKIVFKNGSPVEGERAVLETSTYNMRGGKVDTAYFLAAGGSLTGKEVYKYDDNGNIIEMTLHNVDGSVLSKETYAYEFDSVGNWTKMTTSVAIIEGGKVTYEPTEVTYRVIAYYFEENVAKMAQPASGAAAVLPETTTLNRANVVELVSSTSLEIPSALTANTGLRIKFDGESPARPVARGPIKPISSGLLNGKAIRLPMPVYPEIARKTRATGLVSVEVVIDTTGKVIAAKALSGPTLFYGVAENAALQARFSPTILSGQPVKVLGSINYNFTLPR